jgi:hypothetical protein
MISGSLFRFVAAAPVKHFSCKALFFAGAAHDLTNAYVMF